MPPRSVDQFKEVTSLTSHAYPRLFPQQPSPYPPEVERDADALFQALYRTRTPVADIITRMRSLQSSRDRNEQLVFQCVVQNIFDEQVGVARRTGMEQGRSNDLV